MQALDGNSGYFNNVTQDLFKQTAPLLSSIVESTTTDREAVANFATNKASIETQLQDYIKGMNNIRAHLDAIELNARNGNGNAGCTRTPGVTTTTNHIATRTVGLAILITLARPATTMQKDTCQRQS